MILAVFMILSLQFTSLSSQFHKQNSSDDRQILEESFKQKLLKEFGLSSAPNVSALKAPEIPAIYKYLVETENRKFQEHVDEDDDFHAKTKQIFLFPEKGKPVQLFRPSEIWSSAMFCQARKFVVFPVYCTRRRWRIVFEIWMNGCFRSSFCKWGGLSLLFCKKLTRVFTWTTHWLLTNK